jgi:hypothetical protein
MHNELKNRVIEKPKQTKSIQMARKAIGSLTTHTGMHNELKGHVIGKPKHSI